MTSERTPNVTGSEFCRWCGDAGWLLVEKRLVRLVGADPLETEAWGPCPFCEEGWAVEFPRKESKLRPPWGEQGYWRGRATVGLEMMFPQGNAEPVEGERKLADLIAGLDDATAERMRRWTR